MARKLGDVLHFFLDDAEPESPPVAAAPQDPVCSLALRVAAWPGEELRYAIIQQLLTAHEATGAPKVMWQPGDAAGSSAVPSLHFTSPDGMDVARLRSDLERCSEAPRPAVIVHGASTGTAARRLFEAATEALPGIVTPSYLGHVPDERAVLENAAWPGAGSNGAPTWVNVVLPAFQTWLQDPNAG